jgi:hypothetical protein
VLNLLHIVNFAIQSRFVNAAYSFSKLFLAMINLVLRETSVDCLDEREFLHGACPTSEPAAAAIDSHETKRI